MSEEEYVYSNTNSQQQNAAQAVVKKPSKLWYLVPVFLSIIGGIVGYIILKDRDRKMARNILIIGIVILVIEIVLADVIYSTMTSQPITTQNTSNNTSETNKNETETNLTSNVIEFGKLKPVNWTYYSNGSLNFNVLNKFNDTVKLNSIFTDYGIYRIPNGILIDSNQTSDYILAELTSGAGSTKSSYAFTVTLYFQYEGYFFSSTGTLTGYRDVQNSM